MARPIWSGAISFGLVNVPIRLYPAVSGHDLRFRTLRASDGSRIRQKRVCSDEGEELSADEIVRGYEVGEDKYVQITDDELASLAPESTRAVDVNEFVDASELDPVHYESTYHVLPTDAPGAARGYALLVAAMEDADKVALGHLVLRAKEHMVALRVKDGKLLLSTLLFPDELVPASDIPGLDDLEKPAAKEVKAAAALVKALEGDWEHDTWSDEHRERLLEIIEQKAAGQEIVAEPEPESAAPVSDLMAALEASLKAAQDRSKS